MIGIPYRVDPDHRYPCVTVESDGYLYVEQSDYTDQDVSLRLSTSNKLALAADLIEAARKELREAAESER